MKRENERKKEVEVQIEGQRISKQFGKKEGKGHP